MAIALAALIVAGSLTAYVLLLPRGAPTGPDVQVTVVGRQWQWEFFVRTPDGKVTHTVGELWLKLGQIVELSVTAADVAHAFYIADFPLKVDAIPGMFTTIQVQLTRAGAFTIRNAEYGVGSSAMVATLFVVP